MTGFDVVCGLAFVVWGALALERIRIGMQWEMRWE